MKQSAYIFDVDGVLNDMHSYEPDGRIISQIATLLDNSAFVAINTGRGYEWVEESVVQSIRHKLQHTKSLVRLFVAAEMGGLGIEFTNGNEQKVRSAFGLSPEQITDVKQTFKQYPDFVNKMKWYEGKVSMATVSKGDGVDIENFKTAQQELTKLLQDKFKDQHVKVANSTDAVDVHAPEAGKWAGAQLIYDWLRRVSDIQHDHFICFGDSIVDYEMGRFFAAQNHDAEFVFTGPTFDNVEQDPTIKIVKTRQPYCEGTYRYLRDQLGYQN